MTDNEQDAVNDFLNILEVEPSNDSDNREQLAVLVATGKAKEIIEQDLTQDKVKRLFRKDIEGYFRKCEIELSPKNCDAIVDKFL